MTRFALDTLHDEYNRPLTYRVIDCAEGNKVVTTFSPLAFLTPGRSIAKAVQVAEATARAWCDSHNADCPEQAETAAPPVTDLRTRLIHAATAYDRRQENKRGYNRHALAQYFAAIDAAMDMIAHGATVRQALERTVCDRLFDTLLNAARDARQTA